MNIIFSTEKHLLEAIPKPLKANKKLPEYFKAMPPQSSANPQSGTVKKCVPFLEASSFGYIIPLWSDVFVTARNGDITIEFPPNLMMETTLSSHDSAQIKNHPLEKTMYGSMPLKFHNPWIIETSENVSCLFTSPLNHMETRFKILDGVVDTDNYYNNINFPFIWTGGDGEFFIPQGTPLVQIIPFARSNFEASYNEIDIDRKTKTSAAIGSVMRNGYKNKFHHKRKDLSDELDKSSILTVIGDIEEAATDA